MEQCIPHHSIRRKHNLPWLTTNIVRHMSDVDKADMLNDFFAKCWNCTEPPLSNTADAYVGNEAILDDFMLTSEEVLHHIIRLDVTKANGPDGISGHNYAKINFQ